MTLKKYKISLDGLLAHENIIFKLICSVSERTKNRTKSYELSTVNEKCDIYINDSKNKNNPDAIKVSGINVWVTDSKEAESNTIKRPLIASRVLHTLDKLLEDILPIQDETIKSDVVDKNPVSTTPIISEEEASELAIVHDKELENPANKEETAPANNIELTLVKNEKESVLNKTGILNVMVVDDSPSVRKQLEIELDMFDVAVDFADSAEAAFKLLNTNVYDLALLDVVLPDKDGFQICKFIKANNKETIAIMLTGKATQADKIKGSLAGCDDYLIKPVGRETFQNAVKNYISIKTTNKAIEA